MSDDEERRRDALRAHWAAETILFNLKPWECPPCQATGQAPERRDTSAWALSWPTARKRRLEMLAADPNHYRDLEPQQ